MATVGNNTSAKYEHLREAFLQKAKENNLKR